MPTSFLPFGKIIPLFVTFASIAFIGGCAQPDNRGTQPNLNINTAANLNTNTSVPAAVPDKAVANVPITLPLLDAMLADEAFVNEAKTSIQISDEQIQKLRDAARNAVLNLNQEGSGDDERSTRSSVEKAKAEVTAAIGPEKTARLMSLVQQRWTGDGGGATVSEIPNSIPTDTRIVVNAPAYRMDIFKEGKLMKSYKIGIGYPEFPLPTGLRKMSTIIFNPTWTPPDEPWVKGNIAPGKKVEAGSKLNPLGPIKIPIGLPSLVHGGKSADRMGTFASHGCVGLTNPQVQDFAMQISSLSDKPLTMQEIKEYEKAASETKEVKLDNTIPVELRYETIVVENGKLKIYRDVYERGTNTEENLRRVLDAFGVSLDSLISVEREKLMAGLEMMAIDALGSPVEANQNVNSNVAANKPIKPAKTSTAGDGKVTRNIKGKKEVVFELAELRGKGYPAPVNMK